MKPGWWFSNVFRRYRKRPLAWNGLMNDRAAAKNFSGQGRFLQARGLQQIFYLQRMIGRLHREIFVVFSPRYSLISSKIKALVWILSRKDISPLVAPLTCETHTCLGNQIVMNCLSCAVMLLNWSSNLFLTTRISERCGFDTSWG